MKIKLTTDSASDLTQDEAKKLDCEIIPLTVVLGDKDFLDGVNITNEDIYNYVNKSGILPKTSAVSEYTYNEIFEKYSKTYDAVIHIALSSGISASCQNAKNAAKNFNNVFVVDSLSLSSGVALLVYKARELTNLNKPAKEIADTLTKLTSKVQASFVIETLDYLRKGGRCTMLQALGANVFKIRPSLVLVNGKIISGKKHRGKQINVIEGYVKDVLENHPNADKEMCFVTHSKIKPEYAEYVKQIAKNFGFKNIYERSAGSTITSHCGPGTIGLLYLEK